MAITHTAPWDKQTHQMLVSQLEPLCTACGGFMIGRPSGLRCVHCDGIEYEMVQERDAPDYRRRLIIASEWAERIQTDETRVDLMRVIDVLRHPTPLELVEADGERIAEFMAEYEREFDAPSGYFSPATDDQLSEANQTRRDLGI